MKTEEVELTSCLVHKLVVTERLSRSRRSISALRLSPPRLARTTLLRFERFALLELYRRAGITVEEILKHFWYSRYLYTCKDLLKIHVVLADTFRLLRISLGRLF